MLTLTGKLILLCCDGVGGFAQGLLVHALGVFHPFSSPLMHVDVLSVLYVHVLALLSWT